MPAAGEANLSYRVKIDRQQASGAYSARMTADWALLRGDNLVPAAQLKQADAPIIGFVNEEKLEVNGSVDPARLAMLDDAALKDLGLSRADVIQESERPFWDDPLAR